MNIGRFLHPVLILTLLAVVAGGCGPSSQAQQAQQAQIEATLAEEAKQLADEQALLQAAQVAIWGMAEEFRGHIVSSQGAIAVMTPTAGNNTGGLVTFTPEGGGVAVKAMIHGLTPGQHHAIGIHQFGDLSLDDGMGTGGHYNPEDHPDALPETLKGHGGNLGNLTADSAGKASYSIVVSNITIDGDLNPIIGRGVIIHAKVDDGGQVTGNAGARISQGVIGYAKPAQ